MCYTWQNMIGLQKPDIIEYFNQKKSGADTVDQMTGAHNVARDTRRWPPVTFYTTVNIAGTNAQTVRMLNGNVKIRHRTFIGNPVTHLVSEQINRHSETSTGVHKPLHLKLHQFQSQIGGNPNDDIDTVPSKSRKRKRCVRCYASKMSRL